MTTADRIKFAREKIGMSQEELAKRLGLKSRSSIARIEKSGDDVTLKDVERLSDILGCSIPYLMGWEDEEEKVSEQKLTTKEQQFIEAYSRLSEEQQGLVDNLMRTWLSKQ